jgi:hypothetical protein
MNAHFNDICAVAGLKQCAPCRWQRLSTEISYDRAEIRARNDNTETSEPGGTLPRPTGRIEIDLLRHHQIEKVEPLEYVTPRQQRVNGLLACDDVEDRCRRRTVDQAVEWLVSEGQDGRLYAMPQKIIFLATSAP